MLRSSRVRAVSVSTLARAVMGGETAMTVQTRPIVVSQAMSSMLDISSMNMAGMSSIRSPAWLIYLWVELRLNLIGLQYHMIALTITWSAFLACDWLSGIQTYSVI